MSPKIPPMPGTSAAIPALVIAGLLLAAAPSAHAQSDDPVQRLMQQSSAERDRQSDRFALEVQQQQRSLRAPPADPAALAAQVAREAQERREFLRLLELQRLAEREAGATAGTWGPRLDPRAQQSRERQAELDRNRHLP